MGFLSNHFQLQRTHKFQWNILSTRWSVFTACRFYHSSFPCCEHIQLYDVLGQRRQRRRTSFEVCALFFSSFFLKRKSKKCIIINFCFLISLLISSIASTGSSTYDDGIRVLYPSNSTTIQSPSPNGSKRVISIPSGLKPIHAVHISPNSTTSNPRLPRLLAICSALLCSPPHKNGSRSGAQYKNIAR